MRWNLRLLGYDGDLAMAAARRVRSLFPNRLTLGIDEAGRGPAIGPMVMAAVALDSRAAAALTRKGLTDSKTYGAGDEAHAIRTELALEHVELATKLIEQAPRVDRIIADGKRMFAALCARFDGFESHDRAEEKHASVAAASVVAKALRDERFARIKERYEDLCGPIAGGGYANAATRRWVRLYVERHGRLPDEARRTWPFPYVEDLIGDQRPPGPQGSLFG